MPHITVVIGAEGPVIDLTEGKREEHTDNPGGWPGLQPRPIPLTHRMLRGQRPWGMGGGRWPKCPPNR